MLRLTYIYRNLTRNPLRALLTCAAVALPIMIYVLSTAVVDGVERYLNNSAKQLRLAIMHKSSIVNPLPAGHRVRMESLDPTHQRLLTVCGIRWLGGKIENDPRPLTTLAADPDTFLEIFPEHGIAPDEAEAWRRDRQAIVVGPATARQFGWKKGDRITIRPSVPPYDPMEFHIVSTIENSPDPLTLWFRRDYLDEELKRHGYQHEGTVSFFFAKCASKADLEEFRRSIDALFVRSPDETKTQDEKAFISDYITQQFDLPRNLTILGAVTVFVAIMAAANTMSMNFRDRMNEVATLKSMGFGGGFVFTMIQSESMFLCGLGGLIGAAAPYIAFTLTPLRNITLPVVQQLQIHPIVCAQALAIAVGIGIIAAVWPSWMAMRMKVVSALRNLE